MNGIAFMTAAGAVVQAGTAGSAVKDYPSVFVILMGLGTVFFGLICLIALTMVMGRIMAGLAATAPVPAAGVEPQPSAVRFSVGEPDRKELAAAVGAVIAEELGTDVTGIRILSMRRV